MLRTFAILFAASAPLLACAPMSTEPKPSETREVVVPSGIDGTEDSLVSRLSAGMTGAQVGEIIGPYQRQVELGSVSCRSYIYDETIEAKFAHVYFRDGRVIAANDGHAGPCVLGL